MTSKILFNNIIIHILITICVFIFGVYLLKKGITKKKTAFYGIMKEGNHSLWGEHSLLSSEFGEAFYFFWIGIMGVVFIIASIVLIIRLFNI
jgi:hypothetical protein